MQEERCQLGEFWLSKRKNSDVWCITWFEKDTRQTSRSSTGERDFERAKIKLAEHFVANAKFELERPEDIPIAVLLDRYYENHAKMLASKDNAAAAIARWKQFWGLRTVSEMTIERQEKFIAWFERQTAERGGRVKGELLSRGTIARQLGVGRAAFARAYKRHELKSVPYVLPYSDDKRRERILTPTESAALFNAAATSEEHLWRWLIIAFGTAARPNAPFEIQPRPPMLDMDNRRLNLLPPGKKQNRKRRPVLPIVDTLLPWLRLWSSPEALVHQGHRGKVVAIDRLITWRGRRIKKIRQGFERLKARAGITDPEVSAVTIRHTMTTWLVSQGVPEWEREIWLGHRAPGSRTTAGYVHLDPGYLKHAAAAVDAYFDLLAPHLTRPLRVSSVRVVYDQQS